jgi:threonine dehydratase
MPGFLPRVSTEPLSGENRSPGAGASPHDGASLEDILKLLDFERAREVVAPIVRRTPLVRAETLSERAGAPVYLKLENLQRTGSFKIRGATFRLATLSDREREKGIVACSSGNHGRAVAFVAQRFGIPATVCVPEWVDPVKLSGIRSQGAETLLLGLAHETGRPYISAYDDPGVIAGQGTIALEVTDALGRAPAALLAPLSGGGLMGGIAAALRWRAGSSEAAVAVSAERARSLQASVAAGRPLQLPEEETLASALSGGLRPDNRFSFPLIRDLVPTHVTVTEDEIKDAILHLFNDFHVIAEGGGAVAVAALLAGKWHAKCDDPVVVLVSGGNLSPEVLGRLLGEH